jgi:predicted Zn-dependent peptidase
MKGVSCGALENGMRYYGQFDSSNNLVLIGVRVGSIHDPPKKSGMAHVVEHLTFHRSQNYTFKEVERIVEECMGGWDGDINVSTDHSNTLYGTDNLMWKSDMRTCLAMISDLVRNPIIEQSDLDTEKASVYQEYREFGVGDVHDMVYILMHRLLYPDNPSSKRIDCEVNDLQSMTLKDVRAFRKRFYVPKNAFLIVLGPKFEEVKRLASEHFGDWSPPTRPILDFKIREFKRLREMRYVRHVMGVPQFHLAVGFPTRFYNSPDRDVIEVLSRLLARRLFFRLRMEVSTLGEGIYHIGHDTPNSFCHGLMYVHISSTSRRFITNAEKIILQECKKLKDLKRKTDGSFVDATIGMLRRYYRGAFLYYPGVLSELITMASCNGDETLEGLNDWRGSVGSVTIRKIRDAADEYFTSNYAKVLVAPQRPIKKIKPL